jgi:methionyl-tRNA formyltransferase
MKVVFFGTGAFALPALDALKDSTALVVTQPDRPKGRGMKPQPSPAKLLALELGITVETPERSRAPEFVAKLRELNPDALVVASYGQILSQSVLDSAVQGGINLHGSILPLYRGAAPIQRAILEGQTQTGVTLMQMDKGMDTGAVIDIKITPIQPDETYTELQDRLAQVAAQMATEWLPKIVRGDYRSTPQDHDKATIAPKIRNEEAELIFEREAQSEYNRFRAFTDSPGVFVRTRLGRLHIRKAQPSDGFGEPGQVIKLRPSLVVAFKDGAMDLREVQLEGKKRMSGRDFANGARLAVGDCLSN